MTNSYTYASPFVVAYLNDLRQNQTEEKIYSFLSLRKGWHYGVGGPIRDEVTSYANNALKSLIQHGLTRTDAFPGANGEILLTAYKGKYYIEILIEPDHTASLLLEESRLEIKEICDIPWGSINKSIGEMARIIWSMPDSSIQNTTTRQIESLSDWRSKPLEMAARRVSGSPVLRRRA